MKKITILFFVYIIAIQCNLFAYPHRNCLILLDHRDIDNTGRTSSFFLTCKLQSAVAEKSVPMLVHASLWNSFMERRNCFEHNALLTGSDENNALILYEKIKNRMHYWSDYYNENNPDIIQNKSLVVRRINQEFYNGGFSVSDSDNQQLLNYLTPFDPHEWSMYKKNGFYLLIPKDYPQSGFNTDQLETVDCPMDVALNYFESQSPSPLPEVLPAIFAPLKAGYKWNIVLSGHGGSVYTEQNDGREITWQGEPLIADLKLGEFKDTLNFFQNELNVHVLHYSSCYGGGNHIRMAFDSPYHFAVICECLTDCATYCNWKNILPSSETKLSMENVHYDAEIKSWALTMRSPYNWKKFFQAISKIDYTFETMDLLPKALKHITYPIIANISLLRPPEDNQFYPVSPHGCVKVDDQFILFEKESCGVSGIFIHNAQTLLLQSDCVDCDLELDNDENLRIISTKPGKAEHYIKKLTLKNPVDIPTVFWQAEYQIYNKTFLLDQCVFTPSEDSSTFNDLIAAHNEAVIEKVLITQQNSWLGHHLRLFFTLNDQAIMIVSKKISELDTHTVDQEVVLLSPEGRLKYEQAFDSLTSGKRR